MGLINNDERNVHLTQAFHERLGLQSLWGHIQELVITIEALVIGAVHLSTRQAGIEVGRLDVQRAQAIHLILHQRDNGRNNESHTIHGHRWDLKCNRLAATRGHQAQCVATSKNRIDDILL